jgi:pimeloyl-ACP methyl ester carboxylesterase
MLCIDHHDAPNGDGWILSLRRALDPDVHDPQRDPLLIIPGYGMNSFIFGFHPRGTSMEARLAACGFEVWSVDLRAQGRSRRDGGSKRYGLDDLILKDVFSAVHGVLDHTASKANNVDIIGCSLGATMMFAYVVCVREHRVGRLVNMGGPVRWVRIHPLLRAAFASPELLGLVPIPGTRALASVALPALKHVPWLLSFYLHPGIVDMSHAGTLIRTVENPSRHINRDIARWVIRKDLIVDGVNVCEGLRSVDNPLLTVIANADGIVPRETTLWPHLNIGSRRRDLLEVGTYSLPIAHADMFVSDHARNLVFNPLADWLLK